MVHVFSEEPADSTSRELARYFRETARAARTTRLTVSRIRMRPDRACRGPTTTATITLNGWVNPSDNSGVTLDSFTPQAQGVFETTLNGVPVYNNRMYQQTAGYDPAGNQTQMGGYGFSYDGENRLRSTRSMGFVAKFRGDANQASTSRQL